MVTSRRKFLAATFTVISAPFSVHAQSAARTWRIGVFHLGDHIPPDLRALTDGLNTLGYEEGRNIRLDFRNVADVAGANRTAAEFVQSGVDLIVAFGNPTVRAARAATATTPIVMVHVTDPVEQGFVKTLARPGENITGFVYFAVSPAKHIELLKEMAPGLRRILVLTDPRDPATASQLAEIREASSALKLQLIERHATNQADLERIFGAINRGDADGVISASIELQIRFTTLLIRLTALKSLALATYRKEAVLEGALFSYAPDITAVGRRVALAIDRILKGAKPRDIPVERPTKYELVINMKTAKALGLTLPESVLLRADHVIE